MSDNFQKIKNYIIELGHTVTHENIEDQVFVIDNENLGIKT